MRRLGFGNVASSRYGQSSDGHPFREAATPAMFMTKEFPGDELVNTPPYFGGENHVPHAEQSESHGSESHAETLVGRELDAEVNQLRVHIAVEFEREFELDVLQIL